VRGVIQRSLWALNLWYNGFSEFKEWLGVLRVNDVISYRSFFSREVLGKRRGLSIFCGASLSPWVECDVVSILSTTVCLFSAFYLMITFYLPLHSLCYSLKTTFILSETHQWALRWFLASEYCLKNGDYPCLSKGAGEAWLHRWCDDIPSNPSELQKENDFLQQFSSILVTYLFIIILSMLSLFWDPSQY
jgi:hypothetical protein